MRVGDDQQLERLDALLRVRHAGHGVAAVPEDHHRLDAVLLRHVLLVEQRRVEPARRRDAGRVHGVGHLAVRRRELVEAVDEPVVRNVPDPRPVPPGALGEAVIERQRHDIEAEVGGALHVGVAAEDVGAGAGSADIAGGEQRDAERAHVGGADGVLGRAHAPDQASPAFRVANIFATRSSCAPGTPVICSTTSGGYFSTSLRMSSMP